MGRSLKLMLLLLLVNFVSGFRLDLMYIYLIESIRPSLTHLHDFQLLLPLVHKNNFHLHQKDKSSDSKAKFRQASNCCKRLLEAAKLAYANKTKESITTQKHGLEDFWQIACSVLNKSKSVIPLLFNSPEVLSSASDKAKLFAENFSKNSNLDDSGISLPLFPSITNLKLHNISVTSKIVKKVIMNIDSSKASAPDCIPLVFPVV